MATRALLCVVCTLGLAGVPPGGQGPVDGTREYPARDASVARAVEQRIDLDRAERRLAADPTDPDALRVLLSTQRVDESLRGLDVLPSQDAARQAAVLRLVADRYYTIRDGQARGYVDRVRAIAQAVRSHLAALPRDEAAKVALALAPIESQLAGARDWRAALEGIAHDYPGTETAALIEVDRLDDLTRPLSERLAALDRYGHDHPGSTAAAKAFYDEGFELDFNAVGTAVEARGADPTPRFLRVLDIVRELESGRYPASEWVEKAPSLVTGFFVSTKPPPAFAAGDVERMLDAYVQTRVDARRRCAAQYRRWLAVFNRIASKRGSPWSLLNQA